MTSTFPKVESTLSLILKDLSPFRTCLESLKYPDSSSFRDILFSAEPRGLVLKSIDQKGTTSTKAMIRKEFFPSYSLSAPTTFSISPHLLLSLLQTLPEDSQIHLAYPFQDAQLKITIDEEFKSFTANHLSITSTLTLPTYHPSSDPPSLTLSNDSSIASIFSKLSTFKKALKELAFLGDDEVVRLKFQREYPFFEIMYGEERDDNYFHIRFNADPGDVRYSIESDMTVGYAIGGLRLAFSRVSRDSLN
jgi:hypothetical protein